MSIAQRLRLPFPGYLRTVASRTLWMWLLCRALVFVVLFFTTPAGFEASLRQPVLGVPALFVWLDRSFYHERLLPLNLGAAEGWFWAVSFAVALALDGLAELLFRVF